MSLQDILVSGRPSLAVLIDPEKQHLPSLPILIEVLASGKGDIILIGGSTEAQLNVDDLIIKLKASCPQPIVLFPGHRNQLSPYADLLLLPSIISGDSYKYLIGEHIENAQLIKALDVPVASTGYILMKGVRPSSTIHLTNSTPIESSDIEQLLNVSMAAEMLGYRSIYLEAGSGAAHTIPKGIITQLKKALSIPLIVGGGIDSVHKLQEVKNAEPDMIVVGNILEEKPKLLDGLYAELLKNKANKILKLSKSTR